MINLHQIKSYLTYLLRANQPQDHNEVVQFYIDTLKNKTTSACFAEIEHVRRRLLNNDKIIQVTDYGAGSKVFKDQNRKISDIATYSLKDKKYSRLLFRLVSNLKANTVIELGTSLGVTTSYLAMANPEGKVYTIEGCKNIANEAIKNFQNLNINNIELIEGNMDKCLPELMTKINKVDLVLIDGNHTEEATLRYFHALLPKVHENSVLVFDDIYWSKGMTRAWEQIKQFPQVSHTIDLFDLGLVFFEKNHKKQQFVLKF